MPTASVVAAGALLVLVAGGGLSAWVGLRTIRQGSSIAGAKPLQEDTNAADLVYVDGIVTGPAEGHSLDSRLTGTPCVAHAYKVVEERSATPGQDVRSSPRYASKRRDGEESVPFTLEANGREIHVEASDAHLDWSSIEFDQVSAGDVIHGKSGLRAVISLLWRMARRKDRRRRYWEATLTPGDQVAVIGKPQDTGNGDLTLTASGSAPLVVSERDPDGIARNFKSKGMKRFRVAGIVLAIAVVIVLVRAGVL